MASSPTPLATLALCVALCGAACADTEPDGAAAQPPHPATPLRPLIYTELPDLTPRAAAVRERRLMRELLEGASQQNAEWGTLRAPQNLPTLSDADAFGRALTHALLTRDEALWAHAFVSPTSYASLVHVQPEHAHQFVDELQGDSASTWNLFHIERASEAPEGGLETLFEFRSMELGQGRTVSGQLATKDQPVEQHWGNVLKIGLKNAEVTFELRIPKIVRVVDHDKRPDGQPVLAIAAPIQAATSLEMFIAAGMHLKPELLRSQEYPFPLAVGNFWRYRRFRSDQQPRSNAPTDPMESALLGEEEGNQERGPGETLYEIVAIERYGSVRLISYRISYDDQELSSREAHWLVTPRTIYPCNRACVRHIDKLDWLLDHLQRVAPLYQFPMSLGHAWGKAGEEAPPARAMVEVAARAENIEVPAGKFDGATLLTLSSPELLEDPFFTVSSARRHFVQGQGVIKQQLQGVSASGEKRAVIEELIEARIMP